MRKIDGPRVLALGGRAWRVAHIDWARRRCYVEPADLPARSLWQGVLPPESYELSQAQRSVLLGSTPDVEVSQRAQKALTELRHESSHRVWERGTVVERLDDDQWWWTFAGGRGNATLAAALGQAADPEGRPDNQRLRLRSDVDTRELRAALERMTTVDMPPPIVTEEAVTELKFGEILPPDLAARTLALRLSDEPAARRVANQAFRCAVAGPSSS